MRISSTRDWTSDPTGTVPKYESCFTLNSRHKVPLARIDPNNCAATYKGTCKHVDYILEWRHSNFQLIPHDRWSPIDVVGLACLKGKCRNIAKVIVTAGLKWAPEMCPTEYTITITINPHTTETPGNEIEPYILFTATEPQPAKITKYVPITSATTWNKKSVGDQKRKSFHVLPHDASGEWMSLSSFTFCMRETTSGEEQRPDWAWDRPSPWASVSSSLLLLLFPIVELLISGVPILTYRLIQRIRKNGNFDRFPLEGSF